MYESLAAAALEAGDTETAALAREIQYEEELTAKKLFPRIAELAQDPGTPLLERARFLAIFASNLDEFFMVRVAGLKRRQATGLSMRSADGLTIREQLELIYAQTAELTMRHAAAFSDDVMIRSRSCSTPASPTI